ncbi:uncharacterized protein At5g64816-like isoform X1 [Primulina tabacum]|uniref:uncharacterized protein At5g64816-like isoform X1 n=1 Tax=Primulina tabacum TaxID=48773 RepID=UPI003F596A53
MPFFLPFLIIVKTHLITQKKKKKNHLGQNRRRSNSTINQLVTKATVNRWALELVELEIIRTSLGIKEQRKGRQSLAAMVEVWWSLVGAAVPVLIAGQAFRMKAKYAEEQRIKSARGREKTADDIFVCERVCTSKRILNKVGAFSKDPIPDTCVTVCGVSELDACSDACARTVCINQHQVPNWNDVCLRRCQSECLKISASRSS